MATSGVSMASYDVDVSLTGTNLLFALINHDNGTSFDAVTCQVGVPVTNGTLTYSDFNTNVDIGNPKYWDVDHTTVYYNRMDIQSAVDRTFPLIFCRTGEADTSGLATYLQTAYGLGFLPEDIAPVSIDTLTSYTTTTLTVAGGSLGWYGQTPIMVMPVTDYLLGGPDNEYLTLSDGSLILA